MESIAKTDKVEPSLKFKSAIDSLKLSISCPIGASKLDNSIKAYRFCHNPIDVKNDFLPNVLYDPIVGMSYDYSSKNKKELDKCGRCAASFHMKIEGLILIWSNMPPQIKEKLGYTSISEGDLGKDAGLVSITPKGHVGLYEYEGATFQLTFKIVKQLS